MNFLDQALVLLEEYRNTSSEGCVGGWTCSCHLCRRYFAFRRELDDYRDEAWAEQLDNPTREM